MPAMTETDRSAPAPRPTLAYHHTEGTGPTIVFLPGYASDMRGTKALALEAWAKAQGRAFLRFDYGGCGQSGGRFEDQSLTDWRDDTVTMLERLAKGPAVLVGSSLGGWIMLLVARERPDLVAGLVGVAPAPDFTDWGFTTEEKLAILGQGQVTRPSPYGPEPTLYTNAFWTSGEANRMMFAQIPIDGPIRLVQGQLDRDVPYMRTVRLAELLRSADVQTVLVKDGDHRLSRDADIAVIVRAVEDVIARL